MALRSNDADLEKLLLSLLPNGDALPSHTEVHYHTLEPCIKSHAQLLYLFVEDDGIPLGLDGSEYITWLRTATLLWNATDSDERLLNILDNRKIQLRVLLGIGSPKSSVPFTIPAAFWSNERAFRRAALCAAYAWAHLTEDTSVVSTFENLSARAVPIYRETSLMRHCLMRSAFVGWVPLNFDGSDTTRPNIAEMDHFRGKVAPYVAFMHKGWFGGEPIIDKELFSEWAYGPEAASSGTSESRAARSPPLSPTASSMRLPRGFRSHHRRVDIVRNMW